MQKIHINKNKITKLYSRIHNLLGGIGYHHSLQFKEWTWTNMSSNSIIICSSFAKYVMDFLVSKPENSHHSSNAIFAHILTCMLVLWPPLLTFYNFFSTSLELMFRACIISIKNNNIMNTKCIIVNINNFIFRFNKNFIKICWNYKAQHTRKITRIIKILNKNKIKRLYKLAQRPRSTSTTHELRDCISLITSSGCKQWELPCGHPSFPIKLLSLQIFALELCYFL